MPSYRIEEARSGRAKCQNKECKDSGVQIQKGELRFGTWVDTERIQSFMWRHWGCVTPKIVSNVNEQIGEGDDQDIDALDGYEDLPSEFQDKVLKALADGHVDNEDWKGDPEMNQPGRTGFRVRTPKKKNAKKDEDQEEKEDAAGKEEKPKATKGQKKGKAANEDKEEASDAETPSSKTKKRTRLQVDDDANDAETYQPKRPRRKPTGYPKNVPPPSEDEDDSDDVLSEPPESASESESPEPKKRGRKAKASKPAAKPAAKRGRKKADDTDEDAETPAAAKPKRGRKKAA